MSVFFFAFKQVRLELFDAATSAQLVAHYLVFQRSLLFINKGLIHNKASRAGVLHFRLFIVR